MIVLADAEVPWDRFWARVVTEMHGGRCRIGVGGRVLELAGFCRSCQEAELALQIQKTAGGPERITLFDNLGIYKILGTAGDTSAMERFVTEWLGPLIDYDAGHGTPLVLTLSEYLDCGGNDDASAKALSVHRSTLSTASSASARCPATISACLSPVQPPGRHPRVADPAGAAPVLTSAPWLSCRSHGLPDQDDRRPRSPTNPQETIRSMFSRAGTSTGSVIHASRPRPSVKPSLASARSNIRCTMSCKCRMRSPAWNAIEYAIVSPSASRTA